MVCMVKIVKVCIGRIWGIFCESLTLVGLQGIFQSRNPSYRFLTCFIKFLSMLSSDVFVFDRQLAAGIHTSGSTFHMSPQHSHPPAANCISKWRISIKQELYARLPHINHTPHVLLIDSRLEGIHLSSGCCYPLRAASFCPEKQAMKTGKLLRKKFICNSTMKMKRGRVELEWISSNSH